MIPNHDYKTHKNADNQHQNYILQHPGKRKTKLNIAKEKIKHGHLTRRLSVFGTRAIIGRKH